MGRTFPPPVRPRLDVRRRAAARHFSGLLCWVALVVAPVPGVADRPAAEQPTTGESVVDAGAGNREVAAARRLLYPRWDPGSGLAGEPFRSPSLGLEAADMRLVDFQVAAVPGASRPPRLVAAALLEPQGFPAPYTLLEVAVLERGDTGLRLVDNLKVRVDSGSGPRGLRMRLPRPGPQADGDLRFDVRVTDPAGSLRHRFRHDRDGIALLESIIAR